MGTTCSCTREGCKRRIESQAEVEETLKGAFSQRFRLANASAFQRPDHQQRYGLLEDKDDVQALLNGTTDLNDILDEIE